MGAISPLQVELTRYCYDLLTPAPQLQVWEWAEENIYLSERTSALPGRFSTVLTPYIREPLQAYADKSVTDLVLCFGTQTAKTTVVMVGTAYRIVNDPTPTLWVMPNLELAKSFSKTRWQPMVNDCAPLAEQKPDDRHLFGTTEQHFDKVTLNFVGSNSPSNLASRPAGLLNMDETDKFKMESDREAGALQLAEERTKTFAYPLRVKTSTPTTIHGDIWREFKLGDQRYYNVPCPHCDELVVFKFSVQSEKHGDCGIRWWRESEDESKTGGEWDMEKVRQNTFYKAQCCGGEIFDHHKPAMLRAGRWIPTNPNAEPGRRSYHLNSLYSLLGKECMWGVLAVKWLQTKGSITKRHNFINSTLAETWDDEKAVDDNPIFTEGYSTVEILTSSIADRVTILAADCQHGHFWVTVRNWAKPTAARPNGESWLLHAGKVEGGVEELQRLQREYQVEGKHVILDIAHFTNQVAKWLVENNWRGAWGSDKKGFIHTELSGQRLVRVWSPVQYRDPMLGTQFASEGNPKAKYVYWSNDQLKDLLSVLRYSEPTIFHVHSDVPIEYQRHLNAEIKTTKKSFQTGRITYYWRQLRRDNHLLDAECMNLLRALQLGFVPMPDEQPTATQRSLDFATA
ncbi:MAG: hypothetical protein QOE70_937 [Chthoniobacter sp.]|jgi:hypothetical protein|nr:hypothetical protein [Chthoniobacter sp.]